MLKRGILGCELKIQVLVIGIMYCAISAVWIALGSLLIQKPELFDQNAKPEKYDVKDSPNVVPNHSLALSGFSDFYSEEELAFLIGNENENSFREIFIYEGKEVVILSIIKLVCSVLLILAVKVTNPLMMVPWLVEELLEMMVGALYLSVQGVKTQSWDSTSLLPVLLYYSLGLYCVYSVVSYQTLLKRGQNSKDRMVQAICKDWHNTHFTGKIMLHPPFD